MTTQVLSVHRTIVGMIGGHTYRYTAKLVKGGEVLLMARSSRSYAYALQWDYGIKSGAVAGLGGFFTFSNSSKAPSKYGHRPVAIFNVQAEA